jgi:hypothetical protein
MSKDEIDNEKLELLRHIDSTLEDLKDSIGNLGNILIHTNEYLRQFIEIKTGKKLNEE